MKKIKVGLISLGCEKNLVDSEMILGVCKEAGFEIAEKLGAEFVCATGRKLVFYRRSKNAKVEHIIF